MPTLAGKKTIFPSISSIIGRAFPTFRQKMDGPNPSEMNIKAFIPAPTCCLQSYYTNFLNWEKKIKWVKWKNEETK